jgi:acetylornithine deacetylase/succinyl-diaminopimelate desuccinylase
VQIDRRTIPGETDPGEVLEPFERLAAAIRDEYPDVHIEFELGDWSDAAEAPPDDRIVRLARDAVATGASGSPPASVGFSGITDARYYLNEAKIPTVILGPGSLGVAHAADEWVRVDELIAAARAYARLFVAFLGA